MTLLCMHLENFQMRVCLDRREVAPREGLTIGQRYMKFSYAMEIVASISYKLITVSNQSKSLDPSRADKDYQRILHSGSS